MSFVLVFNMQIVISALEFLKCFDFRAIYWSRLFCCFIKGDGKRVKSLHVVISWVFFNLNPFNSKRHVKHS